jgi:hypothetical protein
MAQAMYDVLRNISGVLGGAKYATDENVGAPDRIAGGIGSAGSALNLLGMGLGSTSASSLPALTALSGNVGAAGLLPSLGTGFLSIGGLLGAGAAGYGLGKALDWGVGKVTGKELSTHASDAMVGTVDDNIRAQGQIPTSTRGVAGLEAANQEAMNRAIAHTRTLPGEQIEMAERAGWESIRRDEQKDLGYVMRHAQADAMSHWGE